MPGKEPKEQDPTLPPHLQFLITDGLKAKGLVVKDNRLRICDYAFLDNVPRQPPCPNCIALAHDAGWSMAGGRSTDQVA